MRIGIDIDNTIICYDKVFTSLARENGIEVDKKASKSDVKRCFHDRGMHDVFTRLQGQAYGSHISLAKIFDGVLPFLKKARGSAWELFLISHKTEFPIIGERINLHDAVKRFLIAEQVISETGLDHHISLQNVFLEPTLDLKLNRIGLLRLNYFVDDLPNVLLHEKFPSSTLPILFSQISDHEPTLEPCRCSTWSEITASILRGSE
jgi:hypothetical protein